MALQGDPTPDQIDQQGVGLLRQLEATLSAVQRYQDWLAGVPDATLVAKGGGITQAYVDNLKSAFTVAAGLRTTWNQAGGGRVFAARLWGPGQ